MNVLVFAARKYQQPVTDDLGDKSVFEFQRLTPEQRRRRLQELGMDQEM